MFQSNRIIVSGVTLAIILSLCGMRLVTTAPAQDFQTVPIVLQAEKVLPREVLSGPNYTIKETVRNDGFVNTYEMGTPYGSLKVESTGLLLKRAAELRAVAKLGELEKTNVYQNALKTAALGPVKTAEGLVTAPVETVKGVASGIGNFFAKVGDSVTSSDPDKDKPINAMLGQSAFKREFAYEFGVDPYTSFEPLQKTLDDVSWTAAVGGLTAKAAFMAIPGGAGAVVGYSGTAETMRSLVRDKTPPELEKMNRESLGKMGVDGGLASRFLSSTSYSPQDKTFLVGGLASMTGVMNRRIFVEWATTNCVEPVALFIRVRAQMMAQYFDRTRNVDRFISAGGTPLLLTKNGVIVGIFPLDHVAWTSALEGKERTISEDIKKVAGVKGKELWIGGTVDPVARGALEAKGWKVEEKLAEKLLKK
jgi:hypothetical protein